MNIHERMLPSGAAANALRRDRVAELSDTGLAQIEFEPWDLADVCEVPTNEQWQYDGPEGLFWLRLASTMVRFDKAELVERTKQVPDEERAAMIQNFARWAYRFRTLLALIETAQERLPVALASLEPTSRPPSKDGSTVRQKRRRPLSK